MNRNQTSWRRRLARGAALFAGVVALTSARAAWAEQQRGRGGDNAGAQAAAVASVVLFPATVGPSDGGGAGGDAAAAATPSARQVQEAVTDALRKYLSRSGVSVTVYDKRLPSIQRAVNEGGAGGLRAEDAAAGPGDDPRKAQRLADIVGAAEYITATIDNYKYDPATRTASFNLSVFRNTTSDAAPLGTAAAPAQGVAPADVAPPRQEGSAAARAAETAAEQAIQGLFPRAATAADLPAVERPRTQTNRTVERVVLPAFGVILGILVLSNR
jgi:hypothetical protein